MNRYDNIKHRSYDQGIPVSAAILHLRNLHEGHTEIKPQIYKITTKLCEDLVQKYLVCKTYISTIN